MFEGLDMSKLGNMLKEVQDKAQAMNSEAEAQTYTAKSGGGLIKVSANGKAELIDLEIDDSLLTDKSSLIVLLVSAANDALKMANSAKEQAAFEMVGQLMPFGKRG
ncbi:nucleoid-associated protein [Campylobacterota bacterium]|nr:nucleoid-associated protein [Campylobacterota bacterium]